MAKNNKTVKRGVELYIDGKEIKNDIASIERESRALNKELKSMTMGTEEYRAKAKRLKELNGVLAEHRANIRAVSQEQKSWLSRMSEGLNKYGAMIATAMAGITGLSMSIMKYREDLREREDTKADVKALTGLDDESVNWLEEQAKTLSTTMTDAGIRIRSSATEILEAYKLVGSAKPELLKDKEALNEVTKQTLILAQASGMDLRAAVDAVTLSMNQYGAAANEAANYANVMAAGSKYGAAAVESVTTAVQKAGVAASTAGVPIETLVGAIEALAEKGIKNEIAGTGLKTFFLKLESQADDVRPSVVGLQTALENLATKNLSAKEMIKMFGLEAYTVAQALVSSADKVKYYTEAVTGTNVAIEQAGIKSETAAARMEQLKNQFNETGMVLAQQLAPVFSKFMGWTNRFIQSLPVVINFAKQYGGELIILSSTIAVLTLRTKAMAAITTTWQAVTAVITKTIAGYRAAMVLTNEAIAGCSLATTKLSALMVAQNIVVKLATATVAALKTAYYALTFQLGAASRSFEVLKVAMASTGIGALIVAVGVLTTAVYKHVKAVKDERKAKEEAYRQEREMLSQYREESAEISALKKVIDSETASYDQKRDALKRLQEIVPDYHGALNKEGELINDNRNALDEYLTSLKKTLLYQANFEKLKALYQEKQDIEDRLPELETEYWKQRHKNTLQGADRNSVANKVGSWVRNSKVGKALGWDKNTESGAEAALKAEEEHLKKVNEQIDNLEEKVGKLHEEADEVTTTTPTNDEPTEPTTKDEPEGEKERQKRIREELLQIDAQYDQAAAQLKQKYINGEIASEQEYSDMLQAIELARLDAKMKVQGLDEQQRSQYMDRIMSLEVKMRQKLDAMVETKRNASLADQQAALKKSYDDQKQYLEDAYRFGIIPTEEKYQEYLTRLQENYELQRKTLLEKEAQEKLVAISKMENVELHELELQHARMLLSEEQYEQKKLEIQKRYMARRLAVGNQSDEQEQKTQEQRNALELEEERKKFERQKQLFDAQKESIKSAAEQFSDTIGEIGESLAGAMFGDTDSLKDAGKQFLKMALDIVEKFILIKQAQIMAESIAQSLTIVGAIKAAAVAALKMAAIKAAFGLAKGAVNGFEEGGYTPHGRHDEAQGVVHSDEFVANRHATANPDVNAVLGLIDDSQKTGKIKDLSGEEIAAVAEEHNSRPGTKRVAPAESAQGVEINVAPNTDKSEVIRESTTQMAAPAVAPATSEVVTNTNREKIEKENTVRTISAAETPEVTIATEIIKTLSVLPSIEREYSTGGYTPNGKWNQAQGIVHSDEFVANRHATANPDVNAVLSLIDAAQKSGSIRHLSGADIAAVANNNTTRPGVTGNPVQTSTQQIPIEALVAMMSRVEKTMALAQAAYEQPSQAIVSVLGKYGINEAQDLVSTMQRNARR